MPEISKRSAYCLACFGTAEHAVLLCAVQTYMYLRFPSETITRSGYQIKRKNYAVVATQKGMVYGCVAR